MKGNVSKSCDVPNCRPNYYADTGTWTITLDFPWIGYPKTPGTVQFFGFKDTVPQSFGDFPYSENYEKKTITT